MEQRIVLGSADVARLRGILAELSRSAQRDLGHLSALTGEIDRAKIVEQGSLPPDVIALHSHVSLEDTRTGASEHYVLVPPAEADVASRRVSVTAPLGIALLGFRVGDVVTWEMPGGERRLRILGVRQSGPCSP